MTMQNNWNEFDWEKELRKDDERIHTYMSELPRYIDLPDEDGIIMKQIQRRGELVPHGAAGSWPPPFSDDFGEDDPEEDQNDSPSRDDWQKHEGADIYILSGKLAREFCVLYSDADSSDTEVTSLYLFILCSLGKIMARSGDIIDMPPGEELPLRTALCKRLLSGLNAVMGKTLRLAERNPEQSDTFESLLKELQILRERILLLLRNSRDGGRQTGGNPS